MLEVMAAESFLHPKQALIASFLLTLINEP